MDTPENSTQVKTDESNSKVSLEEKNIKADSVIQDDNETPNSISYEHSDNLFNIPLQTPVEFENQLIIHEEMADQDQSNVQSESVESFINKEVCENVRSHQEEVVEAVPIIDENLELISIQGESVEQVIVTTLSEVITCETDSMITTTSTMKLASGDLKIERVAESSGTNTNLEQDIPIKAEGSIDSSNSQLNEKLPSFIDEVDESVSLPPAEPLILEQENNPNETVPQVVSENIEEVVTENIEEIVAENIEEIVTENTEMVNENSIEHEEVAENSVDTEIITENSIDDESVIDNIIENEIIEETSINNETLDENITEVESIPENISLNEIVSEDGREIELTEPPQTEIITSTESNVQYTVLPPGENSVYQEDGTLVVEYPLDTTGITQNETVSVNEFIESNKIDVVESASSEEIVEEVEIPTKDEGNTLKASLEDEKISAKAGTSSEIKESFEDNTNTKKNKETAAPVKPQLKQKGRKTTEGIPPHIIGHSIDKPVQEVINGTGMKPRLGVKIPYRKLASQIVSTSELRNHIMERARLKEEARSESEKTQVFTKKLTHRLAQSLSGSNKKEQISKRSSENSSQKATTDNIQLIENIMTVIPKNESLVELQPTNPIEFVEHIVNEDTVDSESTLEKVSGNVVTGSSTDCIQNAEIIFADNANNSTNIESNSDLIAILEGDGDETSSIMNVPNVVEIVDTSGSASDIKDIEKEISLTEKKISNPVPPQVKEKKFFKSRESRASDVSKEKPKEISSKMKPTLINITSNTKIIPMKKEEPVKINIYGSESFSVSKAINKNIDLKKLHVNVPEKTYDAKGKTSGFVVEVEPQLKPAMVLKTYTRKRKSNDVSTSELPKKPLIMPSPPSQPDPKIDCITPIPPNVYVTKSLRVIKKKVIWDPDEATPSARNQSKILNKIEATVKTPQPVKVTATPKQIVAKSIEKKGVETKQTEPLKITRAVEKKSGKSIQEEKEKKISVEKTVVKKAEKPEVTKKVEKPEVTKKITAKNPIAEKIPQNKIIITSSMQICASKSPPKKSTKRLSEIDRLLMDEGAVNMLYDINNSDDQKRRVSGRTGATPTDKAQIQKELLNRTQEIKNELTQGTSTVVSIPKALRRKEGPSAKKELLTPVASVTRKMSKDSAKSSTHSPPPSPAAFTPAEASRIIRRHSSSSFSSADGILHDEAMPVAEKEKERQTRKKEVEIVKAGTGSSVNLVTEQGKGKAVKKRLSDTPEIRPKKKLKQDKPVVANGEPPTPTEIIVKSEPGIVTGALKTDPTKAFTVIKMNKHYMINLTYSGGESYLTVQLLKDLIVTLKELERTRNCSVVSIISQGPAFCLGIDYKGLVEPDEELRIIKLTEMSNMIREFLKCLLNFSKIIVAGVKGECIGFGVTMLPLFDMVVATDTASFCTPYAKVGCPPEAGFLLSIPYQSNHGLAPELLYTSQRMNAEEAQRRGLITKLLWPEKFDSEFRALLSHISNLSKPALMVTKKQLRPVSSQRTDAEINANCKLLIKFWSSDECQNDFLNYNALTCDIDQ